MGGWSEGVSNYGVGSGCECVCVCQNIGVTHQNVFIVDPLKFLASEGTKPLIQLIEPNWIQSKNIPSFRGYRAS